VLYLAEVQKKTSGVFGGSKAELKLLACQRSEQNWSAVPGEEVVQSEEANSYGSGTLVLVEVTANKQVQRIQEAARQLVSILQNFSRLQEKFKTQEEEIEQWKQSLTYQSQELNRREMEMESRREELQQIEADAELIEQQRREVDGMREEANRHREEFERNRQELEGAWDHLRGEMRRLEERQSELQQASVLDDEQARALQDLLNRIAEGAPAVETVREQLTGSVETLAQAQNLLTQHWQTLEQQRSLAQQMQSDMDRQGQDLQNRWRDWHQAQNSLEQARAELKAQESVLHLKQDYARILGVQLQNADDLHQQMYRLADTSDSVMLGQAIDTAALERMPLEELQKMVADLQRELEKLSRFVDSQEEELQLKQQEIDAVQAKIQTANEFDRLNLENELADEQDGYQMLNETLVGQRRNLRERASILRQHQAVLHRRQGQPDAVEGGEIDLGPMLGQIEAQRQQLSEELQKLENQIEQMRGAIQQAQEMVTSQTAEQDYQHTELKQLDQSGRDRQSQAAELWGKVNLYQELLRPIQDRVDELRQRLEAVDSTVSQAQSSREHQLQSVSRQRSTV